MAVLHAVPKVAGSSEVTADVDVSVGPHEFGQMDRGVNNALLTLLLQYHIASCEYAMSFQLWILQYPQAILRKPGIRDDLNM